MKRLFHCSAHAFNIEVGKSITLVPGKQNAQGIGVYFSEGYLTMPAPPSPKH